MMDPRVFLTLTISAAVGSVSSSSEVMESTSTYSCCDRTIKFDLQCENMWSTATKQIATSKHQHKECIHPCKAIEAGEMTLDECVDLNQTAVCTDEINVAVEKQTHYKSIPCSGSLRVSGSHGGSHGSGGLSWLPVLIGGLIVKQITF